MAKINLTDKQKQYLKDNFSKVKKSTLKGDRLNYYNRIAAGKKRAANTIRIEGKYFTGEIVDILKKIAKKKKMKLQDYIDQNHDAIVNFIDTGTTETYMNVDRAIDLISSLQSKYIFVDDGNGETRMKRNEAIQLLARFEQHVKSTTNVVMLAVLVRIHKNGKVVVVIPTAFENYEGDELIDYMLEIDGIDFIESGGSDNMVTKKVNGKVSIFEKEKKKAKRKSKSKKKPKKRKVTKRKKTK